MKIMSFDRDHDKELKNIKYWPNFPRMFPISIAINI